MADLNFIYASLFWLALFFIGFGVVVLLSSAKTELGDEWPDMAPPEPEYARQRVVFRPIKAEVSGNRETR